MHINADIYQEIYSFTIHTYLYLLFCHITFAAFLKAYDISQTIGHYSRKLINKIKNDYICNWRI